MPTKSEREIVREARFWAARKKDKENNRAALGRLGLSTNVRDQCWIDFEKKQDAERKKKRKEKLKAKGIEANENGVNWRLPARKRRSV